jgi:penicillin G amidase
MRTLKRILIILPILLIVAGLSALLLVNSIKKGAHPVYTGEMVIDGLGAEVDVFFDERGMPHIYAGTEADLYFATGYLMGRERLWQMDLIRRATRGRLSEIFGSDFVETDLFLRSLCMTEKSKMILGNAMPDIIQALENYCRGVNLYISEAGKKLPPEFRILGYKPDPWSIEDVANIIGYMGWDLASSSLSEDIFNYRLYARLGQEGVEKIVPDWKASSEFVFPQFSLTEKLLAEAQAFVSSSDKLASLGIFAFSGSNNWAVSGSGTTTGKPILSNDMHLGLSSPGIWMQMHQVVPGKLNVTGVAVPGQPFIVSGHNEAIAWGMTNLMVDDIDLFKEATDSSNPGRYMFNGNWMEMEIRKEIIKVKGGDEVERTIKFTHHGPVISDMRNINDAVLSMRWSGYDLSDELYTVYRLNRASSWSEFRDAISRFRSISQNFVYADTAGNIGLHTGGGIPVRKGHGTIIRDGSTDEYDWKGYVPFEQLPFVFNPEEGYVASANNKTVSDDYPYYIATSFAMPYRISRIRDMIGSAEVLGIDDFKTMVTDQKSFYPIYLVPVLMSAYSGIGGPDKSVQRAYELLKEWDSVMDPDEEAPAIFEFFRIALAEELLSDELGDLFGSLPAVYRDYYIYRIIMTGPDRWVDRRETAEFETLDEILRSAFGKAVLNLENHVAENSLSSAKWGDIHQFRLEHPLGSVKLLDKVFGFNSQSYRAGGSYHTVCPFSYGPDFVVNHGASQRHIYNTGDWDDSWSVIPTGNSGVPGTPYYMSQTETYLAGRFYQDHFSAEAVKLNAKQILKLRPVAPEGLR